MILTVVIVAAFFWLAWDVRARSRSQRERDDLKHITGASPWWGRR